MPGKSFRKFADQFPGADPKPPRRVMIEMTPERIEALDAVTRVITKNELEPKHFVALLNMLDEARGEVKP